MTCQDVLHLQFLALAVHQQSAASRTHTESDEVLRSHCPQDDRALALWPLGVHGVGR